MSIIRRASLAAVLVAACVPAAAAAAPVAPPLCVHASPFAGADFGARTNPTLAGTAVAFDGSCSRATADIGLSSVEPDEWVWDFGDGTNGSGPTPSHTYTAPGTYTVTLTEWGRYSGGRTWSISQDVIVL
jgi:chitodextrinase